MKKITAILLLLCLLIPIGAAAGTVENARILYDLGLLKGTGQGFSEEGLELGRNATRTEVCITVVRMLGKEEKANYQANGHPFSDVPLWGSAAVGWLYENYLVNGVSDTYFGAQDTATVQQFSTMLLRTLGYSDKEGDFSYDNAVYFAINIGLLKMGAEYRRELTRQEMIDMCYTALRLPIKNSKRMLIRKLCDEKAVDRSKATALGILSVPSVSDSFASVPETLGGITASREGNAIKLSMTIPIEHYGIRVFMQDENGGAVTEIKATGFPRMEKGEVQYLGGGSAGYIREIYIRGLDMSKKYEFIVLKTTSEGALYQITGKSRAVWG